MFSRQNYFLMPLLVCVMISSCGFQLRGTGEQVVRIPVLYLVMENKFGDFSQLMNSALQNAGTRIAEKSADAPWSLFVSAERNSRRVASTNSQISAAKYELHMQIDLRLESQDGAILIPDTTLSTERLYEYDSSNLTGSGMEEQLLNQDMRLELIQRIMTRVEMTLGNQNIVSESEKSPTVATQDKA